MTKCDKFKKFFTFLQINPGVNKIITLSHLIFYPNIWVDVSYPKSRINFLYVD